MPQRTTTPQVPTGTIRMRIIGGWHRLDDMCQMRVLLLLTTVMICNATRCHEHLCSRSSRRRRTTRSRAAGSIGNPSRRPRLVPQLLTFLGQERPKTDRPHVTSGRAAPAVPVTRSRAPRPPPPPSTRRPTSPSSPRERRLRVGSLASRRMCCLGWGGWLHHMRLDREHHGGARRPRRRGPSSARRGAPASACGRRRGSIGGASEERRT